MGVDAAIFINELNELFFKFFSGWIFVVFAERHNCIRLLYRC